jgi:hypothetical protein
MTVTSTRIIKELLLPVFLLILAGGCEQEYRYPPEEIPDIPVSGDDKLVTYEDPDGYPGVPLSGIYAVRLIQGKKAAEPVVFRNSCPVYQAGYMNMLAKDQAPLDKFRGRSVSWVNFSFSGSVKVEVRILDEGKVPLSGRVRILPSRYGINPVVEGGVIRFTLREPGQFSVEVGEDGYKNGLMIFANPMETDVPSTEEENYLVLEHADGSIVSSVPSGCTGLYFRSGVHDIGIYHIPAGISNVYLEGGAWVYGTLIMDGRPDVRIFGRGVLSAGRINYRASHIVVEDSKRFSVRLIGQNNRVEWVKVIGGWVYNVDGISAYAGSTVSHCFIWANDDNIKVYRDNITFSDIVCWQLDNGAIIQMSWGGAVGGSTARNVKISRVDVLHAEWDQSRFNSGLFNCVGNRYHDAGRYSLQENWLVEDVVTENPVAQIINLRPDDYTPIDIHGLVMKNWNVTMDMSTGFHNFIVGNNPAADFDGFLFDNFVFNGTRLTESNWISAGNFSVDKLEDPGFN